MLQSCFYYISALFSLLDISLQLELEQNHSQFYHRKSRMLQYIFGIDLSFGLAEMEYILLFNR